MNWRIIFRSLKNKDMQKRLLIVVGIIVVYRLLAHIPVPLAEPTQLRNAISSVLGQTDLGGILNLLSGGALSSFSLVLVGLSPFITASIIIQLLTKAIPKLEELHKDGETGRRKIQQWTRMITVPLAIVQSIAFIFILRQTVLQGGSTTLADPTAMEWIVSVTAMTAGSVLLMWLGELITEQGIGNGISIVIFAGIKILRMQCFSLPLLSFFAVSSMFMQNIGHYFSSLLISISRQGFFYLPLLYILPALYGKTGIYLLQPFSDVLSFLFALAVVYKRYSSGAFSSALNAG